MKKLVAAVVVTFNRLNLLKENIKALNEQSFMLSHIIIVNNNSSDGTKEYLDKYKDDNKYIIINTKKNIGGAGGFNRGLKSAINDTNDDYFWLMDDDTMPTYNSLDALVNKANLLKNKFGFLCSNVRWKDGSPSNVPDLSENWQGPIEEGLLSVDIATFVSFFVNRDSLNAIGYPIADFFIWGDDIEYSLRLNKEFDCYMVINSKIIHKSQTKTSNQSIITDNSDRIDRYFYSLRNLMYIGHKYQGKNFVRLFLGKMKLIVQILFRSNDMKFKRISIVLNAFFKGLKFNPQVEKIDSK